ncbi:MAG TPA: twin-arginine translocase TatA/TatE family subunit [Acidobacteriaceae bacterium]|nr:twin-arginine translocase TatA/TatE family subunit [Acidobacteriaceae bacterium]
MPGFGDSAFIILLALLLFGPKKLPVLARQLGKLMGDFRRASNEFRTQMEEELRISEQAERQKQIAALEASAPPVPPVDLASSAASHTPPEPPAFATPDSSAENQWDAPAEPSAIGENSIAPPSDSAAEPAPPERIPAPLPIATSGDLTMMPPSTGLPVPKTAPEHTAGDPHETELETESLHG